LFGTAGPGCVRHRQPWLVDLSRPDTVTLTCQTERRLPHSDPFDRQITIGLGRFIELFVQAAAADGSSTDVVLFPDGEPGSNPDDRPVAPLVLARDRPVATDPSFAQALLRRTDRDVRRRAHEWRRRLPDPRPAALGRGRRQGRARGRRHQVDTTGTNLAGTWEFFLQHGENGWLRQEAGATVPVIGDVFLTARDIPLNGAAGTMTGTGLFGFGPHLESGSIGVGAVRRRGRRHRDPGPDRQDHRVRRGLHRQRPAPVHGHGDHGRGGRVSV
jgi:hypothetical protein